jgi:hypothetical protein
MTAFEIHPVHALNRFVYDLLLSNGVIGARADYGGKTPIIPSQQEPEFTMLNKPFIVYAFADAPPGDIEYVMNGTAAYAVYSADHRDIVKILNVMREALKHFDESATVVNNYKYANTAFRDILFTTISVSMVDGPSPADTEGGRHSGAILIRYSYQPAYNVTIPTVMT